MGVARKALGGVCMALWFIGGALFWIAGFAAYFNNFEGLARFAGLFLIPTLALPLIGKGTIAEVAVRGFYWWGWFVALIVLAIAGAALLGQED
jgi:hypothetical protein